MPKNYYGEQTEKAIKNFPFDTHGWHKEFLMALAQVKKATAMANFEAENFNKEIKNAIVMAADEVLAGLSTSLKSSKFKDQFVLPALMGGAGTSIHMNMNEVLASRATEILKGKHIVDANDHVNRSQSTNDVNPTAIKVATAILLKNLSDSLENLSRAFEGKAKEFKNVVKLGRTHMQDAVPITLGQEFGAYACIVRQHLAEIKRVKKIAESLHLGGSAVGNSANASSKYIASVYKQLSRVTGHKFNKVKNFIAHTGSAGDFLQISQAVTALCMDMSKIATDLRMMSSGPRGGLGEIILTELQKGSSIMPGKVNPVMPETVNNLYYWVTGNNLSIEQAAHGANLQLSVMIPTIADRLIESVKMSAQVFQVFAEKCVVSIKADQKRCKENLERSTAYATLLTPIFGYQKMSEIVKETINSGKTLREIVVNEKLLTNKEFDKIVNSFRP